jgi:predicted Zn-dependent protease
LHRDSNDRLPPIPRKNPPSPAHRADTFRFSNQPNDAIAQYEISQHRDPQHEISFFNAATLQLKLFGNPTRAAELLEDHLRRFPDSPNSANTRGILTRVKAQPDPTLGVADWMRGADASPTPAP